MEKKKDYDIIYCTMDKLEAIPHKLLFSRKWTNHTNLIFSIDFNISQSLLMMRKLG